MTPETISHYRIIGKLGEGGMGIVYRALDTRLERTVALKILPREAVGDPERRWRFEREAKAASALNHPNIVTIYDIDRAPLGDGEPVDFIAMECVEGETLDRILSQRRLNIEEALDYAAQMSGALAAAHAAGIVHRDVKPGNVIVSRSGQVKVLDFGLAKLLDPAGAAASTTSTDSLAATITAATAAPGTKQGAVLGTLAYMSPEQAQGKAVDARSDVFSLGCVLYEMFSGKRPFQQDSNLLTLASILRDPVPPLKSVRPDVPPEVERVVARALEKEPEHRYPSAVEMRDALAASRPGAAAAVRETPRTRRPGLVAGLSLLLLAALAALGWYLVSGARLRRAHEALVRIPVLTEAGQGTAAFRLAAETRRVLPEEVARLTRTWDAVTVTTEPPGADVSVREYLGAGDQWLSLGRSPTTPMRLPFGYYRFRIAKEGFQTVESVARNGAGGVLPFRLDPPALVPPGMVRVAGGNFSYRSSDPVKLDDFWLDKYEVTNKQFKDFVDHGGYQKKEYWKEPFVKDGKSLSWEEAMAEFKDSTGRAGPANWELGTYPEGRGDYPVGGVSWYEAAAYAEFAGKSLPTIFHWYKAADIGIFSDILKLSNFGGQGPAPVGTHQGLTSPGAYDMAGNVREWCLNQTGAGRRYILGGAWSDSGYMFSTSDAQLPFDRSPINGLRCAKYTSAVGGKLVAAVDQLSRDYSKETPASDETYRIYKSLYAYDKTPLNAAVDSVDESSPYWRKEKVSFDAAYGHERVPAYLFLPRNAAPPYQTVVYFPSSNALMLASSEDLERFPIEFVIRSGRALLYPVYKGTYERRTGVESAGRNEVRDWKIACSKDLGRSIDYLQTRRDIDSGRLAYYGLSLGAISTMPLLAVEDRFKAAVLLAGGLPFTRVPPEADPVNFVPRIRIPVLLLGGRQDFILPVDTAQVPLFRLLGTPEKDKKHVIFEGGHAPLRIQLLIKDILDWLDRYLGPVKTTG